MDKASLFSALSLVSVFIYIYVGFYAFVQNKKSRVHKVFLLLCMSYAIWSFAYAFAYIASDPSTFSMWNKVSALGWCTFDGTVLYLVLLITQNKIIEKTIVKVIIFIPGIIFLYIVEFCFGYNTNTPELIHNIFYVGYPIYNSLFIFISIIILLIWGLKSESRRIKRQSFFLVLSGIIPFFLNLLTQTILPLIKMPVNIPNIGQIYSVIMVVGAYAVSTKYKFLRRPENFLFEEIEDTLMDMVIFLDEKNEIIRISNSTLSLLDFKEDELLNKNISCLFDEKNRARFDLNNGCGQEKKYNDMEILKKQGEKIPINISYLPIFDKKIHDFLGSAIVMHDISTEYELRRKNEQLHEQAIRDSLTKLYNHQYSIDIIKSQVDNVKANGNKTELSLMMIDIDFFKKVNDTYGHPFGDYVIETISNILLRNIKGNGYVGRFGGEEFIIILPETGIYKAQELGEKIRGEVQQYKFDNNLKLTISIGIKQLDNESAEQLVKNADDLLYKAKQNGRNRVEWAG